jgi:putative membrane protein
MADRFTLSDADRARISEAVTAAEADTDGEIVTIIAHRSDSYHDVALHWAIAVAFLVASAFAAFPDFYRGLILRLTGGWEHELSERALFGWLFAAMIVKFLAVRYILAWRPLRMALAPATTKARRVRRRAVLLFRTAAEARTRARTGVLIYLSMDEHRAEIVADAAINDKVSPETWGEAMAALVREIRAGRPAEGMAEAIRRVGVVLAAHFPRSADDSNELPDRVIEL